MDEEPSELTLEFAAYRSLIADLFTILRDKGILTDGDITKLIATYDDHRCQPAVIGILDLMPKD